MDRDRRKFLLQLGTGFAFAALSPIARAEKLIRPFLGRPKVAIIGGGIGGVSSAWLLDQAAEVHLFESHSEIGGHAMTRNFEYGGQNNSVDIGAQYFSPISYPTYVKILEAVGLDSQSIRVSATLTVFKNRKKHPLFVSPMSHGRLWPIFDPGNFVGLHAFNVSLQHAKKLTAAQDWNMKLGPWIESLPLSHHQKHDILYPYLVACIGCSKEQGKDLSALSVLFYVTESLGGGLIPGPVYCNSKIGLQGNVKAIAEDCSDLTVHTNATAVALTRINTEAGGTKYKIRFEDGSEFIADHVVMACPPEASKHLLSQLNRMEEQVENLNQFETFPARMVIHTDPIYVPKKKRFWSAVNIQTGDPRSEGSMWFGAMRPKLANGNTVDIFKSWTYSRAVQPKEVLFDQRFRHFLTPPNMVAATHSLASLQGKEQIWFTGAYMGGPVNHETATLASLQLARGIAPDAPRLKLFSTFAATRQPEKIPEKILDV